MSNKDHRSEPREGEITDEQVRGAAMRVIRERSNLNEAQFTEGEEMRNRVRGFFAETAGLDSAEKPQAEKAVDEKKETRELTPEQQAELLSGLEKRLSQKPDHYERPDGIDFAEVKTALEADPAKMWSLSKMEATGGAPDVIAVEGDEYLFADCSAESPEGRRNCVYDKEAEEDADDFDGNAVDQATNMNLDLMDESTYKEILQKLGKFDLDTWSFLKTPKNIRESGIALYGDRNGGYVYVNQGVARYHDDDGAWRGVLRVKKA